MAGIERFICDWWVTGRLVKDQQTIPQAAFQSKNSPVKPLKTIFAGSVGNLFVSGYIFRSARQNGIRAMWHPGNV